ncbi:hypothetical protein [Mucilaginibacter sp. SG564]|uniref:hypothetical protein n=1 Tax=Mucilaginibacter sp. SG564 TaxID=2587022 RepID=UPI00155415B5|nr:hypothetical protein [Mucilaginibacter sp. SG564]
MKTNFGKPIKREEMKQIKGGIGIGCGIAGNSGKYWTEGCCHGLYTCPVSTLCVTSPDNCLN